jgi:hypothetical protein
MAKLPDSSVRVALGKTPPYMTNPLSPSHVGLVTMLSKEYPKQFKAYARAFVTYQREIHTATKRLEEKVGKIIKETNYSPRN